MPIGKVALLGEFARQMKYPAKSKTFKLPDEIARPQQRPPVAPSFENVLDGERIEIAANRTAFDR